MVVASNGNLHIKNVTESMELKLAYWCQVSDRITEQTTLSETSGRIRLRSAVGHHQQGRPTIRDIVQEVSVMEGEEVELVCLAVGLPTPQYTWYCGPAQSEQTGKLCLNPGWNTIARTKIRKPGTYKYSCVARNKYGHDRKSVTVVVRGMLH